jgi:hypothetical protein
LGCSLRESPSEENCEPTSQQPTMSQSMLRDLFSLYPHGQIFMFDQAGSPIHYADRDPDRPSSKGIQQGSSKENKSEKEKERLLSYQ